MSLRPSPIGPIPEEEARVAHAAFPHGTAWMRLRDELGQIYEDATFAGLFRTVIDRPKRHGAWRWSA